MSRFTEKYRTDAQLVSGQVKSSKISRGLNMGLFRGSKPLQKWWLLSKT